MQDKNTALETMLASPDTSLREQGFLYLLKNYTDESEQRLQDIINDTANEGLKIHLCNFIGEHPDLKNTLPLLALMMAGENTYLRDRATAHFTKIESPDKKECLLSMLESESDYVVDFAIEQVGEKRISASVQFLIEISKTADKDRIIKILDVFQKIRATESISTVLSFLNSADTKILFTAIQTLGAFYQFTSWNQIEPFLTHDAASIRKASIWFLNHYKNNQLKTIYLDRYFKEKDPSVLNEILDGLSQYEDLKILHTLLESAVNGENYTIQLKASSALDTFSPRILDKLLIKHIKNGNPHIRATAISKAGITSRKARRIIAKTLSIDSNDLVRIAAAERLGKSNDETFVPLLEQSFFYDTSKTVKYAALLALTKLWQLSHWPKIYAILEYPEEEYTQEQVIVLRFLQKKMLRENWNVPDELVSRILFKVTSPNANIRYLCVEILKIARSKKSVIPLIDLLLQSESPAEENHTIEAIQTITYNDPLFLFSYLVISRRNEKLFVRLLDILALIDFDPAFDYEMIIQFSTLFLRERSRKIKRHIVAALLTIFKNSYHNIGIVLDKENDDWTEIILECVKFAKQEDLKIFGTELFVQNLAHKDLSVQKISIKMAGLLHAEEAITKLTELAVKHPKEDIRKTARKALQQLMRRDQAA
ncbi:MAG: HEAT repeat domain-containing protein [Candidatus Auribacter fodinae]|jgi:HEAT repeat protein|uniref:HEAT repeat domain-containing protein n=1 Tax=Candidatus Auribacter fodinae TaxID=2093366 RepID=A0A3A4R546_9BACT|nr:MAG: HEAT repeat domain-containing protein [Candidatus Auribacter fodinae]